MTDLILFGKPHREAIASPFQNLKTGFEYVGMTNE